MIPLDEIDFPVDCITVDDKFEYLYCAQGNLEKDFSKTGDDYNKEKITKEEWRAYEFDWFLPRMQKIAGAIAQLTDENSISPNDRLLKKIDGKKSNKWHIELDDI